MKIFIKTAAREKRGVDRIVQAVKLWLEEVVKPMRTLLE